MRAATWVGLLPALISLSWIQPTFADRRVALMIGNGAYENTAKLPNPTRDASALAELFQAAGFDIVQSRRDLGNVEFKRALRELNLAAINADIAVVFLAGHGIEINGVNYLLPVDAKLKRDFDVEDEAITLDRILRAVEPAKKLRLVVLDACRDNPFVRTVQRTAAIRSVVNGLGKMEPTMSDTLIAYAAKAGSYSEDGDGTNSPFTAALLKHLMEPGLDIRLALGRVRDDVLKNTNNQQEPFVYGSLGGSSVALSPAPFPPPTPPSEDVRAEYELNERIDTKTAWELFIQKHKAGYYVNLARERLKKLKTRPTTPTAAPDPTVSERGGEAARISTEAKPHPTQKDQFSVASLPRPETQRTTQQRDVLVKKLRTALRRVGCGDGEGEGQWSAKDINALSKFWKHTKTEVANYEPTTDALEAVTARTERVCPLECEVDKVESRDGKCVEKPSKKRRLDVKRQ